MEYLELKVLPESPTIMSIRNDRDEIIGFISVKGDGEILKNRNKYIAKAFNSYDLLLDALMMIQAEFDNGGAHRVKQLASEAYYKATRGAEIGIII